jgi:hypothetical protein
MEYTRGLIRGVGLAIVAVVLAPAIADAASRFTIDPAQPSSTSAITVTFKLPKKLPKGQRWMLGITSGLSSPQSCAIGDLAFFRTRGTKGGLLVATFRPQDDPVDNNPTAWCTASQGASTWGLAAFSATRKGNPIRIYARRYFTIT